MPQDHEPSLAVLLELARAARAAGSPREVGFLLANDTHRLAPYRQAAFWLADEGAYTLSGVLLPEANAPYVLWLDGVCRHLAAQPLPEGAPARAFTAADLPADLAAQWNEWWPAQALWLPLPGGPLCHGGLLLAREEAWPPVDGFALREWADTAWHAWSALRTPRPRGLRAARQALRAHLAPRPDRRWWQQTRLRWTAAVLLALALPVRLTVMAPGELVPANPVVVRAPLDGVIDQFHVQPNQLVKKGQPLFGFDEAVIGSRVEVAEQALATAEAEYRQAGQQALTDGRWRNQLATLTGRIEEKRADLALQREQLQRARVEAPGDGVALFEDPSEWIGKPVAVGERILRIAAPADVEVEAWLPLADAVPLQPGDAVSLYLNASPLSPVSAQVRYMAHDAVARPDGAFAYRVRARLDGSTAHRVGLKGTAKLHAGWVPLAYWVMRRPMAWLRSTVGL